MYEHSSVKIGYRQRIVSTSLQGCSQDRHALHRVTLQLSVLISVQTNYIFKLSKSQPWILRNAFRRRGNHKLHPVLEIGRNTNSHNMAQPTPLSRLPGYDTAPDVYETPELTDDTSTTLQTSHDSASESSASPSGSDDESYGVSRRRLFPSAARERFSRQGKGVEVRGAAFGERLDGVRKGYRVGKGAEAETLEERIARLKREVEECRALAGEDQDEDGGEEGMGGEMEGLRRVLEGLEGRRVRKTVRRAGAAQRGVNGDRGGADDGKTDPAEGETSRIADFDNRLAALEKSLGLASLDAPGSEAVSAPLLPSLNMLDQQLNALMTANSLASLKAASSRIRKLREEAEQLSSMSPTGEHDGTANGTSSPTFDTSASTAPALSRADFEKLQSLYTMLPTLQSLSPTVPALIDRLRSLRTLHSGAANAAAELEDVERSQEEMDQELKAWREGLERVEKGVEEANEANGRNGKVVQGWVRDLEGRIENLR